MHTGARETSSGSNIYTGATKGNRFIYYSAHHRLEPEKPNMSVEHIHSEKFPRKPHNVPAVKVPGLVFCAGQTAGGEIKQATVSLTSAFTDAMLRLPELDSAANAQKTCLQNLKEVLELSGSSLEKVVKYNGTYRLASADSDEVKPKLGTRIQGGSY